MTADMDRWIRSRAGWSVDPDYPAEPASEAEAAWRQLDTDARAAGWDRANFTQLHDLAGDDRYRQWAAGRATYDPSHRGEAASFGAVTPVDLPGHSTVDLNKVLHRAIVEAHDDITKSRRLM